MCPNITTISAREDVNGHKQSNLHLGRNWECLANTNKCEYLCILDIHNNSDNNLLVLVLCVS